MENEIAELVEKNLRQVWAQRDASERIKIIESLYSADAKLFEEGHQTSGYEAINDAVTNVLQNFPQEFTFFLLRPIAVNGNMAKTSWGIGSDLQAPVATGIDITLVEDGKIKALYVFLD
ncbi:nuclear transport factor 2 family protein [Flavobacterium sp.]|uniref:nuclear transport factor 2 family protein n=1 Tax=Flavobacterium sp. TaxID=239 RepID=UPI001221088D|nr:nuclear transport factor 2 family protein [Flavobacterium sp.]RZJ73038.1 MAG: nuclear transport factor 2 family protein [Flavobacterium sp.]